MEFQPEQVFENKFIVELNQASQRTSPNNKNHSEGKSLLHSTPFTSSTPVDGKAGSTLTNTTQSTLEQHATPGNPISVSTSQTSLDVTLVKQVSMNGTVKVVVVKATPDGLVANAGVTANSFLIAVDGREVAEFLPYRDLLRYLRTSRPIKLTFDVPRRTASMESNDRDSEEDPKGTILEKQHATIREILSDREVDLTKIRALGMKGFPDIPGIRSICWRLLLGVLPKERSEWGEQLEKHRALYAAYKSELLTDLPHATSSRPSRLKGQAWFEQHNNSEKDKLNSGESGNSAPTDKIPTRGNISPFCESEEEEVKGNTEDVQEGVSSNRPNQAPDDAEDNSEILERTGINPMISHEVDVKDNPLNTDSDSSWNRYFQDTELREEIWKDVQRTHPGLHFFTTETYEVMERILFLYAKLNPGVRYVQGMNEVLAPLLFVLGGDSPAGMANHAEADTFFAFSNLMSEIRDLYIMNLDKTADGLAGRLGDMMQCIAQVDDQVYQKLNEQGLDPQYFGLRWITTLLAREFELPDTVRVWDSLFADPHRFSFLSQVCCAMVVLQREAILRGSFGENMKLLQNYPPTQPHIILNEALTIRDKLSVASSIETNTTKSSMTAFARSVVESATNLHSRGLAPSKSPSSLPQGKYSSLSFNLQQRFRDWSFSTTIAGATSSKKQ